MSALDAIAPTVVYRWPDDWRVRLGPVEFDRTVRDSYGKPVVPVVFTLCGPLLDDRWSVAHLEHDVVWEWSVGRKGWQLPEVPRGEALSRMLGFLLDLGVGRPRRGIRASLVTQIPSPSAGGELDTYLPSVPYPRWVDDVRWERRYEEADRFVLKFTSFDLQGLKTHGMAAADGELFLGHLDHLDIYQPDFYEDDLWHATCRGQSRCVVKTGSGQPESPYFHAVIDQLLDSELLLPASSRRAWEAEHVRRGEWVIPSPDEIEVYRMMGETLPLLWGSDRLVQWLWERP